MSGAAKAIISVLVLAFGVAIVLLPKNRNQESPMSQDAPANQKYDDASWHYDGDFQKDCLRKPGQPIWACLPHGSR